MTIRQKAVLPAALLAASGLVAAAYAFYTAPQTPQGCVVNPRNAWALRLTASGKTVWRTPVQGWNLSVSVSDERSSRGVFTLEGPAPLVTGRMAVIANGNSVTVLRLSDGQQLWRWSGPGRVTSMWQWHGTIGVLTFGTPYGQLVGLKAATGAQAWKRPVTPSQGVLTADGGIAMNNGPLEVVSLADGKVRWHRLTAESGPLVAVGGTVVASDISGALTGYDSRTGAVLWTSAGYSDVLGLSAASDHSIVAQTADDQGNGSSTVLDSRTGRRLGTGHDPSYGPGDGPFRAGPYTVGLQEPGQYASGMKLVGSDSATGAVRWSRMIAAADPDSTAAVSGPEIVVTAGRPNPDGDYPRGLLLAYQASTGRPAWKTGLPSQASGQPAPVPGGLVAASVGDRLNCPDTHG